MIKPEFFDDPDVADISLAARLCFIGLWTQADRDGRLIDDVRRLKVRLFPYDTVDVDRLLSELAAKEMITRYVSDSKACIWIPKFCLHQRPHPKEPPSVLPPCNTPDVERNGKPCKNISDPSESGVLNLDSGTRKLDHKEKAAASPPSPPPVENPNENLSVITKIAHEAIDIEGVKASLGDLSDAVKSLCSIRAIAYDSRTVAKAVDSALAQRKRSA